MKRTLAIIAAFVFSGQAALAANVYVRNTQGNALPSHQVSQVTDAVKRAVRSMPEHRLVQSESQADFVLQPSVVRRGTEQVLRIEKRIDGNVIAMSEEPIASVNASDNGAMGVTETAMAEDQYVNEGSSSASTYSGDSASSDRSMAAAPTSKSSSYKPKSRDSVSGSTSGTSSSEIGGESRGASPRFSNPDRIGYFNIGAGPAFALGLETDNVMYNINGGYNIDITDRLTGKAFGDLNLATGADSARLINLGVGANVFVTDAVYAGGRPYLTSDVGYGFARDNDDKTKDAITGGVGAGFQFAAAQLNIDVNLHYALMFAQIDEDNPSVLGLRVAVNF